MSIKCPRARAFDIPSRFLSLFSLLGLNIDIHQNPQEIKYWMCRMNRIQNENQVNVLASHFFRVCERERERCMPANSSPNNTMNE